jgi:L-alanine-DL-glutamate epimerase-like enolase superfamily enzyme
MRVDSVTAHAYRVSTAGGPEADGTLTWDSTTIVVVHVHAGDVTGLGWTYADAACVPLITGKLAPVIEGQELDVPARWVDMRREIRNLGRPGLVSCAMSAVDIALWDAAARCLDLPVSRLLGRVRADVPLYGSGGFTNQDVQDLTDWVREMGIPRVKMKIAEHAGADTDHDLARIETARSLVGPKTELYVDANGGYSPGQARRVARHLEDLGVRWFEEPVTSDNLAGLGALREVTTVDIAAGEYGYDLPYFARMAPVVDCLQVDVTRCGGYTEWARAAAVAAAVGIEVSAHCAPNLSAHVAVATQNFRHIEWFTDHDRIENMFFDGVLDPTGGTVTPSDAPGHGMDLRDVHEYLVS